MLTESDNEVWIFLFIFAKKRMISKGGIDLGVCYYCKCVLDVYSRTVDHVVPESMGGIRSNSNKVPCCVDCNRLKGGMDLDMFEKALSSMVYLEVTNHKKKMSYLKKVRNNVLELKNRLYERKRGFGSSIGGS